jgi:hypothetical protein
MRTRIRDAIDRAPVRGPEDLPAYLDSLEVQARRQGQVTAFEVEPGIALLRRHGTPEDLARFAKRMRRVQEELERVDAR